MQQKIPGRSAGFTLVEMLVAFAILGGVVLAVGGFILAGVRSYNSVNAETGVQNEAQIAMTQLQEVVIDASLGVSYNLQTTDGTDHFVRTDAEVSDAVKAKYLDIFNWNEAGSTVDALLVKFDPASKKLLYYEKPGIPQSSGTDITTALSVNAIPDGDWDLLAEGVEEFSADLSRYEKTNQISISLRLTKEGKTYESTGLVTLRNNVLINPEDVEAIYERVDKVVVTTITGVDLTTEAPSMVKGSTMRLYTRVMGVGYPNQSIYRWTVEGVTGVGVESGTLLYDSLDPTVGTEVSVNATTKMLAVAYDSTQTHVKITATAYAGKDDAGNAVYVSDSEYVAVKEITNFSIQPLESSMTRYPDNNSTLIWNNSYGAVNTSDPSGMAPPAGNESGAMGMDVYPNNIIDMKSEVTGPNLEAVDQEVQWGVLTSLHPGAISVNSSGVVAVNRYAQPGWAIIMAYPKLNPEMKLYYVFRIGSLYATGDNALAIRGADTVNRGGSQQLTLTLNGYEQTELEDYDWTVKVLDSLGADRTSGTTVRAGKLAVSSNLSFDYNFTAVVTARMKSNPDVYAVKLLSIPKVTLTMTPPTLISQRGKVIPEGSTRCIVTGLEKYSLRWSMASQTNPSYYAATLPNGSFITGKGDTCLISISGDEPAGLTYMRCRASLEGYTNYYGETYISLKEVTLSISGGDQMKRGESLTQTINVTPSGTGIKETETEWTVVKAVDAATGSSVTTSGISITGNATGNKGSAATLKVASNYLMSTNDISVTLRAVLSGITREKTVTIAKCGELSLSGDSSMNRGGTAKVTSTYGTNMEWTLKSDTAGEDKKIHLSTDAQGDCVINLDVDYDISNGSSTSFTVTGKVKDTNMVKDWTVTVNQVTLTVDARETSASKKYNCTADVGNLNAGQYRVNWSLAQNYNYVALTNNSDNTALLDLSNRNCKVTSVEVVAVVTVGNPAKEIIRATATLPLLLPEPTSKNLNSYFSEGGNLETQEVAIRDNVADGGVPDYKLYVEKQKNGNNVFRVQVLEKNVIWQGLIPKAEYRTYYPETGYIYLYYLDGIWYYTEGKSGQGWVSTDKKTVAEVFHVETLYNRLKKASTICNDIKR